LRTLQHDAGARKALNAAPLSKRQSPTTPSPSVWSDAAPDGAVGGIGDKGIIKKPNLVHEDGFRLILFACRHAVSFKALE